MNAGQEMDSARDCKYKFSINLVKKKPEYRTNPVNYPFGIQFILLLSMPKNSGVVVNLFTSDCFCLYVL